MNKKLIRLTEGDLHRIVKESVNRILDEGWSSYVDYYYPDNEKEPKENNYLNPEKAKKEPSKSSRVRRREYMRKKQGNVEESTIMRLTESDLHKIVKESVNRVLRENGRDIDDDNYFGGGLPDRYFDDYAPDDDRISKNQIAQLDNIANTIANIANNTSDEAELLFQAADCIDKFTSRYKKQEIKQPSSQL